MRFNPGHFLECRNGVFGSLGLDIRSGLRTKLQAPMVNFDVTDVAWLDVVIGM